MKLICMDLDGCIAEAPMIELVAMDSGGTIKENGFNLLPELKERFDWLRSQGVKLAVVSGRDPLGVLYFIHRSQFIFDYIGTGGGGIMVSPDPTKPISELFNHQETIESIYNGRGKADRFLRIKQLVGCSDDEMILIDDNPHPDRDIHEIPQKLKCHFASPATNNEQWKNIVRSREGFVSNLPCGRGVLEILNHHFGSQ